MNSKYFLNVGRAATFVLGTGFALAASAGAPSFSAQQTFATGSYPYAVTTGDLNGDGLPDMVATNDADGTVSVYLNTTPTNASSPTFTAPVVFAVGGFPESVKIVDVNGDGLSDIVTANSGDGTITVLLNTTAPSATTPTFAAPQVFAVGTDPESVMTLDVNGDGSPDLAVANYADCSISVLLNTTASGSSTVSFSSTTYVMDSGFPFKLSIGDMNGDGLADIVAVSDGDGGVIVLLNTTPNGATTPSFSAEQEFTNGLGDSTMISVADVNGDGIPDVVVNDIASGNVLVLVNTTAAGASSVSFANPQTFAVGNQPQSVRVLDLNGDGLPEIVSSNALDNTLSVLENTTTAGSQTVSFTAQPPLVTGQFPLGLGSADFNGDGKQDLIVTNNNDLSLSVFLNTSP